MDDSSTRRWWWSWSEGEASSDGWQRWCCTKWRCRLKIAATIMKEKERRRSRWHWAHLKRRRSKNDNAAGLLLTTEEHGMREGWWSREDGELIRWGMRSMMVVDRELMELMKVREIGSHQNKKGWWMRWSGSEELESMEWETEALGRRWRPDNIYITCCILLQDPTRWRPDNMYIAAVWNCASHKSLGPDGFNFNFYKKILGDY